MEENLVIKKMGNETVSVIIGTYNRSHLLPRCLDSIFGQTHQNLEVIVVNDASTDGTSGVLDLYKNIYSTKLIVVNNEKNKGIAHNSNLGFNHSKGEYIALIGDDDYWIDMQKIEKQLALFNTGDKDLAVIGTWWAEKEASGNLIHKKPPEPKNWKSKLLEGGGVICGSTPLIKRTVWIDVCGFDEKLPRGTDSDLFRRIVLSGRKAIIIPEVLTIVDVGHAGIRMTPTYDRKAKIAEIRTHFYIIKKYLGQYLISPIALFKRLKSIIKIAVK